MPDFRNYSASDRVSEERPEPWLHVVRDLVYTILAGVAFVAILLAMSVR